jgi:hypothetical protein
MGLGTEAWQDHRTGERSAFVAMTGGQLGLEAAGVPHL